MSGAAVPGPPWPATHAQRLVLVAALADDDAAAVAAWDRFVSGGGLDHVDREAFRLLPLVHRRLRAADHEDDASPRLAGIAKRSWVANRLLLDRSGPAVDALVAVGVEPVVLKGAALASLAYGDLAARPLHDLDLLVDQDRAGDALAALVDRGWRPRRAERVPAPLGSLPPSYQRFRHALALEHPDGGAVDLHWHLSGASAWDGADAGVLARAVPFELDGRRVRTLDATDHVVHAVVHGTSWSPVPAVRWLADVVVLARGGAVDWVDLPRRATELRVAPPVLGGLLAAHELLGVSVPPATLDELSAVPVGPLDRAWFAHRASSRGGSLSPRGALAEAGRYRRSMRGAGPGDAVAGLVPFLQHLWGLERPGAVPAAAAARLGRRVRAVGARRGGDDPASGRPG